MILSPSLIERSKAVFCKYVMEWKIFFMIFLVQSNKLSPSLTLFQHESPDIENYGVFHLYNFSCSYIVTNVVIVDILSKLLSLLLTLSLLTASRVPF